MREKSILSLTSGFLFGLALAAGAAWPAQAARPAPAQAPNFSESQISDLKRISAYLNSLKSVQGSFLQIAGDGRSEQGNFYLKRPGKIRFEYRKPNPNLIVADGTTLAVENSALKTTDRYPLVDSPLRLLLSDNIDLTADPRVAAVTREEGALSVTVRETSGPATGQIALTFADAGGTLELRQWEVQDAQAQRTLIVINDLHDAADIPARLFVIQDLSPFKKR